MSIATKKLTRLEIALIGHMLQQHVSRGEDEQQELRKFLSDLKKKPNLDESTMVGKYLARLEGSQTDFTHHSQAMLEPLGGGGGTGAVAGGSDDACHAKCNAALGAAIAAAAAIPLPFKLAALTAAWVAYSFCEQNC